MEEQFKVSCSEMYFLREILFWISDSWLLISVAAALCFHDCRLVQLVYSYLYVPIFIFFLSVRTFLHPCVLILMLKHQKYQYFLLLLLKTLRHEYQIVNSNIILNNNITTKSWRLIFVMTISQLKIFKTQITKNTRALV